MGEKVLKLMTPKMVEEMGLKRVCKVCRPTELKHGKDRLKGQMCPVCGNHYDEFGNHNKHRAHKWIYKVFQDAGVTLSPNHVESLYLLARIKVSKNEAPYILTIEEAVKLVRDGGRLPE